jgi:CDGSH-type Zn-finger protein/ferredoxin
LNAIIECYKNGPYLVRNVSRLQNSKGEEISTTKVMALCRCGGSSTKPFCDGTHAKIGFSGDKLTDGRWNKRDNYYGKGIAVHDNRGICSHAGFCTGSLPSVFKLKAEPWIDPDGAEVEEIIDTVRKCPSGALSYTIDNVDFREPDREPMIKISRDGPYYVTGGIELKDHPIGEGASKEHYTLCRCGGSKNRPFCDGSHWSVNFRDDKN